ncbi:DUF2561 family protein [Mycobacterium sp. smrl_JER01]|uniref:DUF2561 family protein n=1 Tax=Mycobacterium sp. smrl_JER01 TaxID=3402633 RepID=UPI003AD2CA46
MSNRNDTSAAPVGFEISALDRTDRILLGGCIVAWLAALGAGVAAAVALVDLARGHTESAADSGTPWVLYTIIGVSAAVIVVAVPLLLRARRAADRDVAPSPPAAADQPVPPAAADEPVLPVRGVDAPTEKLRAARPTEVSGPLPRPQRTPAAAVSPVTDRVWLRCTASLVCAMGVATLLIAVATYLMAVESDTVAWVLYGVAGVVTVAMGAIPWYYLRELRPDTED